MSDEVYLVGEFPTRLAAADIRVFGHEEDAEAYAEARGGCSRVNAKMLDHADARALIEAEST